MKSSGKILYSSGRQHFFGCELNHILNLSVLPQADQSGYSERFQQRLVSFVTNLINFGDERLSFDLRIISEPDQTNYRSGQIRLAILARATDMKASEASGYASGLPNFLDSHFQEYEFVALPWRELSSFLAPFPVRHLVQINRRCITERLTKLSRTSRPVGFNTDPNTRTRPQTKKDTISYVFPYLASLGDHLPLFRLMLLQPSPLAISCRMQPTSLSEAEEDFLEHQISICDRFARFGSRDVPEDLSSLQTTLQEQAGQYQQHQTRQFFGLQDNAAVTVTELASPDPISRFVIDAVGSLITEPAGGISSRDEGSTFRYLSGGYDIVELTGRRSFVSGFKNMDIRLPRATGLPKVAQRIPFLFDSIQLSAAFRLPPATHEPPLGLKSRMWRALPAPSEMAEEGVLVGHNTLPKTTQEIRISQAERFKHIYVVGQTGTGKSTVLKTMVLDDIEKGEGVCLIDPHGDLFNDVLARIPNHRISDVVVLDPTDTGHPFGINMLEHQSPSQRHFLIQEFVEILRRLIEDEYTDGDRYVGPIFIQHVKMNLALIMSDPDRIGTLHDLYTIFFQKDAWKKWLPLKSGDIYLRRWVEHSLPNTDYLRSDNTGSMGGYIGSKFEAFVLDPVCRNIFGQEKSTIDFRDVMDKGKILLVNLAKGELTAPNSRLLGMIILAKLQAAILGRSDVEEPDRKDFHIYVDEFQNIATQSFITLLSEARKFHISLVLANQFLTQLRNRRITDAIFGNVGTVVSFRLGMDDAELMHREMSTSFTKTDLINLPNWHACMSTLVKGRSENPFTIRTIPETGRKASPKRAQSARVLSRRKYARKRKDVERHLIAREILIANPPRTKKCD